MTELNSTPRATFQQVVARATRLSLALYDFCPGSPEAAHDLIALAREVALIAKVLRQLGTTLYKNTKIPTVEAVITLHHILELNQRIFTDIEQLVPLSGHKQHVNDDLNGLRVTDGSDLQWDAAATYRATYLRLYMKALRMTTAVVVQVIGTAETTAQSTHMRTAAAYDAVRSERLQLESLIVEQQLSLLRVRRCYTDMIRTRGPPMANSALVRINEAGELKPEDLMRYHEASVARAQPGKSDIDDIVLIRRIASSYIDVLLADWTHIEKIRDDLARFANPVGGQRLRLPAPMDERRRSQQPTYESETEDDLARSGSYGSEKRLSGQGPVLMHVDDHDDFTVESPLNMSHIGGMFAMDSLQPEPPPMTRSMSSSATGPPQPRGILKNPIPPKPHANSYSGPSILNSLTANFSTSPSAIRSPVSQQTYPPPSKVNAQDFALPRIIWRLVLRNEWWEFNGPSQIGRSSDMPLRPEMIADRAASTVIASDLVSRRVLIERNLGYTTDQTSPKDGRRPLDIQHRIHRGLQFKEVEDLVRRTIQLRRLEGDNRLEHARTIPGANPSMPPLDRSRTTPAPHLASLLVPPTTYNTHPSQQPPRRLRTNSNASHRTDTSHTSNNRPPAPRSTRSTHSSTDLDTDSGDERRRHPDRRRRDSSRRYTGQENRSEESRKKDGKRRHLSRTGGLALLGGGGLLALLEGLPDALHAL